MNDQEKRNKSKLLLYSTRFFAALGFTVSLTAGGITLYDKFGGGATVGAQKAALSEVHTLAKKMIYKWNTVSDMSLDEKTVVSDIRANIQGVHLRYSKLSVDKLSMANQITHKWHLAKLKVALADTLATSNSSTAVNEILNAKALLEEIAVTIESDLLTDKDLEYLGNANMKERIKRTKLITLALAYHLTKDKSLYDESQILLKYFKGCKHLQSDDVAHINIMNALGCNPA